MAKLPHEIALEAQRRQTRLARRGPVRSAGVGSSVPLGDPVLTPQQAVEAEQKRAQEPPAPNPALAPAENPVDGTLTPGAVQNPEVPLGPVAAAAEARAQEPEAPAPAPEPQPPAFPSPGQPEPQQ